MSNLIKSTPNRFYLSICPVLHRSLFQVPKATVLTRINPWTQGRWRKEYILNLRESHKSVERNRNQPQPTVGDIVVVHQEKVPRAYWRLAIIEELHGTRAATVRTQGKSRLTRPISLLYPVECVDLKQPNDLPQEIKKR